MVKRGDLRLLKNYRDMSNDMFGKKKNVDLLFVPTTGSMFPCPQSRTD